jgi:hypothetical protein
VTESNQIIDEIRRTREKLLAKHNGDFDALVTELQGLSQERICSGQTIVVPSERSDPNKAGTVKKVG